MEAYRLPHLLKGSILGTSRGFWELLNDVGSSTLGYLGVIFVFALIQTCGF